MWWPPDSDLLFAGLASGSSLLLAAADVSSLKMAAASKADRRSSTTSFFSGEAAGSSSCILSWKVSLQPKLIWTDLICFLDCLAILTGHGPWAWPNEFKKRFKPIPSNSTKFKQMRVAIGIYATCLWQWPMNAHGTYAIEGGQTNSKTKRNECNPIQSNHSGRCAMGKWPCDMAPWAMAHGHGSWPMGVAHGPWHM